MMEEETIVVRRPVNRNKQNEVWAGGEKETRLLTVKRDTIVTG